MTRRKKLTPAQAKAREEHVSLLAMYGRDLAKLTADIADLQRLLDNNWFNERGTVQARGNIATFNSRIDTIVEMIQKTFTTSDEGKKA